MADGSVATDGISGASPHMRTWGSPLNWRTTISPRIKALGWKRFDLAFHKGEFVIADKQIFSAPLELVDLYSRLDSQSASNNGKGSVPLSNMFAICMYCIQSCDNRGYSSKPLWDACYHPLSSPASSEEDFVKHPFLELPSSQTEADATPTPSLYNSGHVKETRRRRSSVGHSVRNPIYVQVECSLCGKGTYVLKKLFKLCIERFAFERVTGYRDDSDDSSDSDDSRTEFGQTEGGQEESGLRVADSGSACSSDCSRVPKLYPTVRWHYHTGFSIWDGCITLAKFFELCAPLSYPKLSIRDRNVLELGAGSGVLGNALAALGARKVVMTDLAYVLPATLAGVENTWPALWGAAGQKADLSEPNQPVIGERCEGDVEVAFLDWKQPRTSPIWPRWVNPTGKYVDEPPIDMIVAADTVWVYELVQPFVDTLSEVKRCVSANHMKRNQVGPPVLDIIVAFERRSTHTHDFFFKRMDAAGFDYQKLKFDDDRYGTTDSALGIYLFQ